MLRGEVQSLEMVRMKLTERIRELEEELKKTKEKLEEALSAKEEDVKLSCFPLFGRGGGVSSILARPATPFLMFFLFQ